MIGKNEATYKEKIVAENTQWNKTAAKQAHKLRQQAQNIYNQYTIEPTEVDGTLVKSRLEALWYEELKHSESFECIECVKVPVWIVGPYGKFLSNYQPDFVIKTSNGERIFVELKPNKKLCLADDRQQRALELNPRMKFIVIGGYPYSKRGVTVRLLTGAKEVVYENAPICSILELLECGSCT